MGWHLGTSNLKFIHLGAGYMGVLTLEEIIKLRKHNFYTSLCVILQKLLKVCVLC